MPSRRDFTKALASFAAASPFIRSLRGPLAPWPGGPQAHLGVQLYTVRDAMRREMELTLSRVRSIGYQEVEFAGYFGRTPLQVRAALGANGLAAPSVHLSLDDLTTKLEDTLDTSEIIGHRWLTLAWIDDRYRTGDGFDRVADLLNAAGERAARRGMQIAYHTHDYIFHPRPDGVIPLARFIERLDRRTVNIELDCYWAVKGGSDPRIWFDRYPGRFPMVHVKDAGHAPGFTMADVGAGVMDWRAIFALRQKAGIAHYFIEHDEPVEPWASITASYRYMSALRLD